MSPSSNIRPNRTKSKGTTYLSEETAQRIAAALERLVFVMELRADEREPRRVEPPGRVIPKRGAKRAA